MAGRKRKLSQLHKGNPAGLPGLLPLRVLEAYMDGKNMARCAVLAELQEAQRSPARTDFEQAVLTALAFLVANHGGP